MRTKKLFTCVIAALTLMYASGCCDAQGCYTVHANPCYQVPCGPTVVHLEPAPPPVAVVQSFVECQPVKARNYRHLRKRYINCEADPCPDNPPLLFQTAAPAGTTVFAVPAGAAECLGVACVTVNCPSRCVPAKRARVRKARAPKPECVTVKAPVRRTKVRGRTRTIIPVINNTISTAPREITATLAPVQPGITSLSTRPVYVPGAPATVVSQPAAPAKEEMAAELTVTPAVAEPAPATIQTVKTPAVPLVPATPIAATPALSVASSANPPLLSESALTPPAAPAARGVAPAVVSASGGARLEPIPYQSPLDRSASGLQSVRGASVMAPAAPVQNPQYLPLTATAPLPAGVPPGSVVEPWMLQRPGPVTASGFEPGALPPCGTPYAAGGCPPASPCPPPASCPPSICPTPMTALCQPSGGMSDCFTMNDDQLQTGPRVLTPNALTPLPVPLPAALPALPIPGQTPAAQPGPSKYEALVPAASPGDFSRADPKPNELSMPAPIGGNIPPVAPAAEIESVLDAMLSTDGISSVPGAKLY